VPCKGDLYKLVFPLSWFGICLQWAEDQKQCNRLKLHDLLVKPMQRITRYSLLLKAIVKKTDCDRTKLDLREMVRAAGMPVYSVANAEKGMHNCCMYC